MRIDYADLLLRIGLAFVFIYAGVSAFVNPDSWIGFVPAFLGDFDGLILNLHIAFNLILGIWLLSGKWKLYSASVSAIALLAITVFNFSSMDIVFRDVGLMLAAGALAFMNRA